MSDERYIVPPWTSEQVASLNAYQASSIFHPFTGRNDLLPLGQDDILIATADGWESRLDPDYHQEWAWKWMADWSWQHVSVTPEADSSDRH